MKLTYAALKAKHACTDQLEIYMENFPDNLEIRKADLLKVAKLQLNLDWFARRFLSPSAWATFEKAMASALAAYEKTAAPALWEIIKSESSA